MKRNHTIISIVIVAIALVAVPIPHSRTRHEIRYAIGAINWFLPVSGIIGVKWVLHDWHQIEITLECTEEMRVTFSDADGALYNLTKKNHHFSDYGYSDTTYDISIINPNGVPIMVLGSMNADEIIKYQEWLPLWIP